MIVALGPLWNCGAPMSEFKFACPVCGQHITADSGASGTALECPTCFQKIVVPQAPALPDSKLIVAAAQANRPRPVLAQSEGRPRPGLAARLLPALPGVFLFLLLAGTGLAAFVWRDKISRLTGRSNQSPGLSSTQATSVPMPPRTVYPVPTNIFWSLELTNAVIPDEPAKGRIRGWGFFAERATLTGGTLTLRQGEGWPPELGLSIALFAERGEDLSGKTVVVTADRVPPLPRVILRWKSQSDKAITRSYTNGYALKVIFGQAVAGRMPGKFYLACPDKAESFAAGTFDAEIRKHPKSPSR
jgi:hypothetical protein